MKSSFKDLSLHTKISLLNIVIISILLLALTFIIFFYQRATIISDNEHRIEGYLEDLENLFDLQVFEKQVQVNLAMNSAREIMTNYGELRQLDSVSSSFTAADQISGKMIELSLPSWFVGETPVHNDFEVVDKIQEVTQQTATIF